MSNVSYSYIHGAYTVNRYNDTDDAVFVKRYRIEEGKEPIPEFVKHENIVREFYITKPAYQKHDGKLEYEYINRLNRYKSTQRELVKNIQRKLGMLPDPKMNLRQLCNNPYIYGVDKDITCVVRDYYVNKFGPHPVDLKFGCMDTETDVVNGTDRIIIMTYYYKGKGFIAVDSTWFLGKETEMEVFNFVYENLPEVKEYNIDLEVKICSNSAECIKWIFSKAHESMVDVIGFWNINFDIPKIIKELKDYGIDPADVFSDPSVPKEYRSFQYRQGALTKVMESGRSMPLAFSQQWHTVLAPASFYFIDPASLYRCLRRQKSEASYAMDYLTKKLVGSGKYKPDLPMAKDAQEGGIKWHIAMQIHYKLHYITYAFADVIQPVRMEEKTLDVTKKLNSLAMGSHWKDFNSNPRRLCDQLDNFFKTKGAIVGTTGSEMETKYDRMTPPSKDWIVTLEAALIEDIGMEVIPGVKSKIYIHNADLDIVSTYPILGMLFNICRETTMFETCKIEGLGYYAHREFGVNLTGGKANATLLAHTAFKLKTPDELLKDFRKEVVNKVA